MYTKGINNISLASIIGISLKTNKKMCCDLMFNNNDTVFIDWIEKLESTCQELIFNKG